MEHRFGVVVLLVTLGLAAILFGVYAGDEAAYTLSVEGVISAEEVSSDAETVEFDYLSPEAQDAFQQALSSDGVASYDGSGPRPTVVHYRDAYYRISVTAGQASETTMIGAIAVGVAFLLLAALVLRPPDRIPQPTAE